MPGEFLQSTGKALQASLLRRVVTAISILLALAVLAGCGSSPSGRPAALTTATPSPVPSFANPHIVPAFTAGGGTARSVTLAMFGYKSNPLSLKLCWIVDITTGKPMPAHGRTSDTSVPYPKTLPVM